MDIIKRLEALEEANDELHEELEEVKGLADYDHSKIERDILALAYEDKSLESYSNRIERRLSFLEDELQGRGLVDL